MDRRKANAAVVSVGAGVMLLGMMACKKDDPPAVAPQPTYTAYPQGTATAYPQGTAYPTATAPAAGGQMATPGPLALPCTNDSGCGLAHCNIPAGKCAFPCVTSAIDCLQGSSCGLGGFCVPGG